MIAETNLRRKETLLVETLLSTLDAREAARAANAPMLVYLADMLIKRARDELEAVRTALTDLSPAGALKEARGS